VSPTGPETSKVRRGLIIVALMAAGEAVFLLPFVLARVFRPTFLAVFGITNLQLGTAFSLYGVVAMVAYFAGGPLADRFSARRLMTAALVATGLGGGILVQIPSTRVMNLLWAFWGLTTILLFWAAMIRATREWGGVSAQGRAVFMFAALLPSDVASATPDQRAAAFHAVIWVFTGLTLFIALLVWVIVPDDSPPEGVDDQPKLSLRGVKEAGRMPVVWLQAVIVVCAYAGYKATDDFSLLARDVLGFDEVAASGIGTLSFWIRAAAAVGAGYLGDRIDASRVIAAGFAILIAGSLLIASGALVPGVAWMLITTIVATSVGIYATPDVFMGPLMGVLLDNSPGVLGHQHVFASVAAFGTVGLIATIALRRITRKA